MATARDEQLRAFLQTYGDLVFTFDPDGRYVDIITHEDDLLYGPPEELHGNLVKEVLPAPEGPRAHELIQRAFTTGEVQTFEYELEVPRGDRWFEARIVPFENLHDETPMVVWVARDVTERKHIEQQLQETNQRFRQLADHTSQQFWLVDADFEELYYANPAFLDFAEKILTDPSSREQYFEDFEHLRQKYEQADGVLDYINRLDDLLEGFLAAFHPEDRDNILDAVDQLLQGESAETIGRVHLGDGEIRWVRQQAHPITDDRDNVYRIAGLGQDITELKQAEQKLAATEQRYRSLVEQNLVGIYIIKDDRFDYVNPIMAEIFGYKQDDMVGMSPTDFIIQEDHDRLTGNIQGLLSGEMNQANNVYRVTTRDDQRRVVETFGVPVEMDGESAILGTLIDITERKQAQEALRESQERFKQLADNTDDFFWLLDVAEKRFIYANRAMRKFWGNYFEDADNLLEASLDRIHPEDREPFEKRFRRIIQGAEQDGPVETELRIRTPDEEYRWFRTTIFPVLNEQGETYRIGGLASDITERKQAREALRESQERFQQLADNTDDFFWLVDVDYERFIYANRALREFWDGYFDGRDDLLQAFLERIHPEDREEYKDLARRVLQETEPGESLETELRVRSPEGEYHWFRITGFPIFNEAGEVYRVGGLASDITERKQAREALRKSETRFRQMAENIEEVFWLSTVDKDVLYTSPAFEEIWGIPLEDLYEDFENFVERIHPDDRERVKQAILNDQVSGDYDEVYRVVRPDGEVRWIHDRAFPIHDEDGNVYRLTGIAQDITKQKRTELKLRKRESYLSAITDNISEAFYLRTADFSEVLYMSPAFEDMTDISVQDVKEDPLRWMDRIHPDDREQMEDALEQARREGRLNFDLEFRVIKDDSTVRWLRATGEPVELPDREEPVVAGVLEDITEQKEARQKLQHEASHDRLTGLPNRSLLFSWLETLMERGSKQNDWSFAVLFIDLDGFKDINDSLGHSTGDQVLKTVAERLETYSRNQDFVARYGGDEFVVLADWVDSREKACAVADRLINIIEETVEVNGREFPLSASIGIVLPREKQEPDKVIRDADIAMYEAKDNDDDLTIFHPRMRRAARSSFLLEHNLRDAVDQDQLRLFYQPIIEINPHRIAGVETLIRWDHPEEGLLTPGKFLEVAEDSGIIVSMGQWVLKHACRQWKQWKQEGVVSGDQFFTVNHSVQEFEEPHFFETVKDILHDENVDAADVNLEMTESTIATSGDSITQLIDNLNTLGLQLCVDDFGTGYSSFARFSQWPFDRLKIDRSFVSLLDESDRKAELTHQMVEMAMIMDMEVIGEGVESETQLNKLNQWDCKYVQGFYFARPMPPDDVPEFIQSF